MRPIILILTFSAVCQVPAQNKLTLEQCIARAEEKNLIALNAALDQELARIDGDQAKWDLLPNLNGAATHGYNFGRVVDRFTNTFANDRVRTNNFFLQSTVTLYEGGRRINSMRQAGIQVESAEQAREAVLNDVRLEVTQAFMDILALRERMRAGEAQVENTRLQVERTEALVDGGRVARADLLTLRSQMAQEELSLTDVQNQHEQRMLALGRGMQMEFDELRRFDIVAPVITGLRLTEPTVTAADVLAVVLARNPAYRKAELDVRSAERGITIARSPGIPSLTFSGSIGTGYSGLNRQIVGEPIIGAPTALGFTASGELVFTPSISYDTRLTPFSQQLDQNLNESLAFTLSLPIFNNMRNRNGVSQARIRHEQTRNRMASVRNDLQRNVLDAIVMQRSAFRQYLAAERAVEAGTLALEYAEERFAAGTITSIELATAKNQLNRNTTDLINAKYQYLMASKYLDILQGIPVAF